MNLQSEGEKVLYWWLIVYMEREHSLIWNPLFVIRFYIIGLNVIYEEQLSV